jgi:hypothetical protein
MTPFATSVSDAVARARQSQARWEVERRRLISLARSESRRDRTGRGRSIAVFVGMTASLASRLFQPRRATEA